MPRPDSIAALHELKYELRFCIGSQKAALWKKYREALELAARELGVQTTLLEAAIAKDFGKWARDEKLPKRDKQD